jgi:hypothetical protein
VLTLFDVLDPSATLIVGDAFITTAQESAYAIALQSPEMHGPPKYFTPDWPAARASVERLAALAPEVVVTGHGRAMSGAEMRGALQMLADDFDRIAVPSSAAPSRNETASLATPSANRERP